MSRAQATIVVLFAALLVTNLWWAYRVLDTGITQTYMADSLKKNKEALNQALALLPVFAKNDTSREEIVTVAKNASADSVEPFEKEGYLWVGSLGLRFNKEGKVVEAVTGWSE